MMIARSDPANLSAGTMPFTYEEVRSAAVSALLSGHRRHEGPPNQWLSLVSAVADILQASSQSRSEYGMAYMPPSLKDADAETLREIFWELFRQGFITLGINESNAGWPFFKLSRFGRKALMSNTPYRFTDTASYLEMARRSAPDLDETVTAYLDEAVQAFHAGCILASNVMLGVAAEYRFNQMLDAISNSTTHQLTFGAASKQRFILRRISEFNKILEPILPTFPSEIKEGLQTQLTTVQEVIRVSRNDAGHPTGKAPDREATYVLLQMFVPFARKIYQLQSHFCS